MTDLATYLDKAERGDPGSTIAQLMEDLSSGKVKHEDVFAHYKAKNNGRLLSAIALFGDGQLFAAQRQDHSAWLQGYGWHKDNATALEFRAVCDLCQFKPKPRDEKDVVRNVLDFIAFMVQPSPGARKHDAQRMGEDDYSRYWGTVCVKRNWKW